jgi:glycosyltransferase involved in cell wall biosynthesis
MKIVFALPAYYNFPIGGYHVHYQYATLLAQRGHDVTIVFPRVLDASLTLKDQIKTPLWAAKLRIRNRPLIKSFKLDDRVKVKLVPNLEATALPTSDVLIATAWQTAEALTEAPARCGRKFYIVYDYEHLMTANDAKRERIKRTYRNDFVKVATSNIVAETIRGCGGEPASEIPCGIDFDVFGVDQATESRVPTHIGFPLRPERFKGAADAIDASQLLRARFGDALQVSTFGSRAMEIPAWIKFQHSPSQIDLRAFYNAQSIFMVPSHFEGWGLPGVEAMACGATLVTTDNGGCRNYAIDGVTSIMVEPGKPEQLAGAVAKLINDPVTRFKLAHSGREFVQRYRWSPHATN